MTLEKTLVMIKPDGVQRGLIGECLKRFEQEKFRISYIGIKKLTKYEAAKLKSDIAKNHPKIFSAVLEYLIEGEVCIAILERENAVYEARRICGTADPNLAPEGTIRGDLAEGNMKLLYSQGRAVRNVIHSSETKEEAGYEINLLIYKHGGKNNDRKKRK